MLKFEFVALLLIAVNSNKELLYEQFNGLVFTGNDWLTMPGATSIPIFQCPYGMSLVQLSFGYEIVQTNIQNIPPHYSVQVIVDIYAFSLIDGAESSFVKIDTSNQIYNSPLANDHYYYNQCGPENNKLEIKTIILEIPHASPIATIQLSTDVNEPWPNEGYPFRNLQLFYQKCYKTCKICASDAQNACITCFTTNTIPSSGVCTTCVNETQKKFLLNTQGCIQECPNGYNYDSQYICSANQRLMLYSQINYNQIMSVQQLQLISTLGITTRSLVICNALQQFLPYYQDEMLYQSIALGSSGTSIRVRASFSIFGTWTSPEAINILINQEIVDTISINGITVSSHNGIILYRDSAAQTCSTYSFFQFRVEINQLIQQQNFDLKFQASNLSGQSAFWSVFLIDIEQLICSLNCQVCQNWFQCQTCIPSYYLHKGQCITTCPSFSTLIGLTCVDLDENLIDGQQSRIKYIVKELFDVSTTTERILQLFSLVTSSINNFSKGGSIYYSYLPDKRVFGGPMVWVNAQFNFQLDLPKFYYELRISFQIVLGDDFNPGQFQYQINTGNIITLTTSSPNPISITQIWGDIMPEYIFQINQAISREQLSSQTLTMQFNCINPTKAVNQAFCAIQNMFITAIYYCSKGFLLDQYRYDNDIYPCVSICGDGIVNNDEECDDGNKIPFDGCFNCRYSCQDQCQFCARGQCIINSNGEDEFYETFYFDINRDLPNDISDQIGTLQNLFICPLDCINCYNDICVREDEFYKFYNNIRLLIDTDQISLIQNLLSCQTECARCLFGICLQCIDNYYLNSVTNICESTCGDEIANGMEQCDDGNNDIYDGCYQCLTVVYNICDNKCAFCFFGVCEMCSHGYSLEHNQCLSICGDNLVNKAEDQLEECDNPESLGCSNCRISAEYKCVAQDISICWTCDNKCTQCQSIDSRLECNLCIDGYYPMKSDCLLCDDNCLTCNIEHDRCTSCYRDDCQLCEDIPGLYTDRTKKQCVPSCGDGIVIKYYEQCDDGNTDEGDGCDSQCNSEIPPDLPETLNVIRYRGDSSNDLSISNSLQSEFSYSQIAITIEGFEQTEFSFNTTTTDSRCEINFQFLKSIYPYNLIHILINYSDSFDRLLLDAQIQKEIQVTPVEQIIVSNDQQSQADVIASAQSGFSYIILIIAPLSILFGVFEYFWAVLEILSWINNFYFLNVSYPFNVQVLFLKSDWSSLVNFPTYSELNQPGCEYYFEAPKKFVEKNVDPMFINNAQVPFGFILISILLYFVSLLLVFLTKFLDKILTKEIFQQQPLTLFKIVSDHKQVTQNNQATIEETQVINRTLIRNVHIVQLIRVLQNMANSFQSRIKQTISLCFLDISMAITLQILFATEFQFLIIFVNEILALLFILLVLYQLYQSYSVLGIHPKLAECPSFQLKYGCYYDGVNVESPFGLLYNFTGLIRKILYIFFTVYFYYNPLLQTSLCFLSCASGVVLMVYSNPFETKRILIQQLISEGCVSIVIFITVLFAIDDQSRKFTEEEKINLGWIIIAVILLVLLLEIFNLIYEILKSFYENLKYFYEKFKECLKNKSKSQIHESKNKSGQKSMEEESNLPQIEKPRFYPINGKLHFLPKQKQQQ